MPGDAKPLAVYALTPAGARLARALAAELGASLYLPRKLAAPGDLAFDSLPELVGRAFDAHCGHVFVAACGIVVRAVAPHLRSKTRDPAVVALDQHGRHAVSLLSGHLGGANDLARRVAAFTGGEAVITTATDTQGLPSLDLLARDSGLAIEDIRAVRHANMALLRGEPLQVFDPHAQLSVPPGHAERFEWVAAPHLLDAARPAVLVTWRVLDAPEHHLVLRPRLLVAGVGCRRGAPAPDIVAAVARACAARGAALKSLTALASIEAKRDEPGLHEAARELGAELLFYPAGRLAGVGVPNPSALVHKHMGVHSVCEAAALLAAGTDRLLAPKARTANTTVALALAG